jgi:hypothetical protein
MRTWPVVDIPADTSWAHPDDQTAADLFRDIIQVPAAETPLWSHATSDPLGDIHAAIKSMRAQDWLRCPNVPPCPHPGLLHDIDDWDDPRPTCCMDGCSCGAGNS